MNHIQVLQGLNLESSTTTLKIKIGNEHEELKKLLDLIKSFHPIFIHEYFIENNLLTIRSKLIGVWNNSSDTLVKLSNKETTFEDAKTYLLETVIKKRILSMSTIPILHAAQEMGYETTLTLLGDEIIADYQKGYAATWSKNYTLGAGKGSQITNSIASSKDSSFGKNIQRDKWTTNQLIERLGLPIAKWETLDEKSDIKKVWDSYEKPIVIKPTGLVGGSGVTVGIETIEDAEKAYAFAKEKIEAKIRGPWQSKVMIQEQIQGDANGADYRILVIDGKLSIVTKRIPAFVIGNGTATIAELIKTANDDPRRDIHNPAHVLKPIVIDEPLTSFLKEQNLNLESIPARDERIYVRKISSMSRGGMTEDFTDQVSTEIKYIVETIAQSMHCFTIGADIMCKDISKPLNKENGGILEVNTMPESYLNFYPTIGTSREYIAKEYVEALLRENKTRRLVCIGTDIDDLTTSLRRKSIIKETDTTGEYKDGNIYINSLLINEDVERSKATEALKINASLDNIVLHFRDWSEVEEYGLGFDKIDYIYLSKDNASNKGHMKIIKKYKRKNHITKIKDL